MYSKHYPGEIEEIKSIFPQGLPENTNILNDQQKKVLYNHGGATLLFLLNEIPALHKSLSSAAASTVNTTLGTVPSVTGVKDRDVPKSVNRLFDQKASELRPLREREAIQQVKVVATMYFAERLDQATVILVYGSAHNFKPYCDKNGIKYEKIYTHGSQQISWQLIMLYAGITLMPLGVLVSLLMTLVISIDSAFIAGTVVIGVGLILSLGAFLGLLIDQCKRPPTTIGSPAESEDTAITVTTPRSIETHGTQTSKRITAQPRHKEDEISDERPSATSFFHQLPSFI